MIRQREMLLKKLVPLTGYNDSVRALGDTHEVRLVLGALILRIQEDPYRAPLLPGLSVRMVKSQPYPGYPGLRLIYRVKEQIIYLFDVSRYDELTAEDLWSLSDS